MALEMSNATQAMSESQVENLVTIFQTRIQTVSNKLSADDPDYKEFVKVVEENWSGFSKEDFMNDMKSKFQEAQKELDGLKVKVRQDLMNTVHDFMSSDSTIYDSYKQ